MKKRFLLNTKTFEAVKGEGERDQHPTGVNALRDEGCKMVEGVGPGAGVSGCWGGGEHEAEWEPEGDRVQLWERAI